MTGQNPYDPHDASLMLKASYKQEQVLLPSDLNELHESAIIKACPPPNCSLSATILQVPHHGSATGLLPDFLTAINPQIALIPVGLNNSYGHPTVETLTKLSQAHIPTYRTDLQGRIHLIIYDDHFSVSTEH